MARSGPGWWARPSADRADLNEQGDVGRVDDPADNVNLTAFEAVQHGTALGGSARTVHERQRR